MLAVRNEMDRREKALRDKAICRQLWKVIEEKKVKTVHTYLPMGSEVDIYQVIEQMLKMGIMVVTPKSLPGKRMLNLVLQSLEELESGIFGTRYPAGGVEYFGGYGLAIVPGLAFDLQFNRIGYGAGYYDIFLKGHPDTYKLGVCYPFQVLEKLPAEPHDVPLNGLLY